MFVCPECGESYPQASYCTRDGTMVESADDDPVLGQTIGAYRAARLIGVGGMGRVYKGVNPSIGSRVAIKVLSRDCASNQELVDRFFAEAKAVNVIRHENIVNVLNLDRLPDKRPFIIMEYLDGKPLSKVISDRGQLPLGTFARIMGETLSALGAAHAAGIIHRDLKPDNIFVTPHGRAKVLDFGIAKLTGDVAGVSAQTRDGSLMGTPHYMSPEQAQARPIDPRTDLYAMGVILFEGVTGRQPFEAEALYDLLRMHVETTPPAPRSLRPNLPPEYEAVILRALSKDPAQRQQSAKELYRELVDATRTLGEDAWEPIGDNEARMSVGMSAIPTPAGPPTPSAQHLPNLNSGGQTPQPAIAPRTHQTAGPPPGQHVQQPTPSAAGQIYQPPPYSAAPPPQSRTPLYAALGVLAALGIGVAVFLAAGGSGDSREGASSGADASLIAEASADAGTTSNNNADNNTHQTHQGHNPLQNNPYKWTQPNTKGTTDWPMDDNFMGRRDTPNLTAIDVSGFIPKATEMAKKAFPDAVITRIDAQGVRPNGLADVTLGDNFFVIFRFVSPKMTKRPADLPIGVEHNPVCGFFVMMMKDFTMYKTEAGWCQLEPVGEPKCTAKQVWRKAAKKGAPTGNVVAQLGYWAEDKTGKPRWLFTIGNKHTMWLPDDC